MLSCKKGSPELGSDERLSDNQVTVGSQEGTIQEGQYREGVGPPRVYDESLSVPFEHRQSTLLEVGRWVFIVLTSGGKIVTSLGVHSW